MLSRFFWVLAFLVLPTGAFFIGYVMTGNYFQRTFDPYPFEAYGLAVGGGCFFWTLALLSLGLKQSKKRGGRG